jgi:hypothetical protein
VIGFGPFTVEVPDPTLTEAHVEEKVAVILRSNSTLRPVDRPAQMDDQVLVDLAAPGQETVSVGVPVGEGVFPGLEPALVGAGVGVVVMHESLAASVREVRERVMPDREALADELISDDEDDQRSRGSCGRRWLPRSGPTP